MSDDTQTKPPTSDLSVTIKFDGSQNHRIDGQWLADRAKLLGMSIADYVHLGLLMLKAVEEKKLREIDDDTLVVKFPDYDSDAPATLETLQIISETLGIDFDKYVIDTLTTDLIARQRKAAMESPFQEGQDNPDYCKPYDGPPLDDSTDGLTRVYPDEEPIVPPPRKGD
jgi:hypothetical protein